jgi:ProP effector
MVVTGVARDPVSKPDKPATTDETRAARITRQAILTNRRTNPQTRPRGRIYRVPTTRHMNRRVSRPPRVPVYFPPALSGIVSGCVKTAVGAMRWRGVVRRRQTGRRRCSERRCAQQLHDHTLYSWWIEFMGFEQLAELRAQLAAKAKQERNAKRPAAQADAGGKPKSGDRPSRGAKSNAGPKASAGAKPVAAKPSAPVDPVVVAIGKLQRRFPRAFPKNPAPKVPLKVGIWEDLARDAQSIGLTEAELRDAMSTWCRGNRYWSCLVEDAVRVDLNGNEAGRVTRDDAARARRLKARRPGKGAAQQAKGAQQAPKSEQQADPAPPQADAPAPADAVSPAEQQTTASE